MRYPLKIEDRQQTSTKMICIQKMQSNEDWQKMWWLWQQMKQLNKRTA